MLSAYRWVKLQWKRLSSFANHTHILFDTTNSSFLDGFTDTSTWTMNIASTAESQIASQRNRTIQTLCHVAGYGKHYWIVHKATLRESCIITRADANCTFICFCFLMAEGKASLFIIGWRLSTRWMVLYLCVGWRSRRKQNTFVDKAWGIAEFCGHFELIHVGRLSWAVYCFHKFAQ